MGPLSWEFFQTPQPLGWKTFDEEDTEDGLPPSACRFLLTSSVRLSITFEGASVERDSSHSLNFKTQLTRSHQCALVA